KLVRNMMHDAVHAFIHKNTDLARDVCMRDDEVDALFLKIRNHFLDVVKDRPDKLSQAIDLISVARNLERIADLTTNLGEEVVFMKEARIIRHGLGS
ncbi:MAG: PhoU domain-containing protein, partial [Calditrichia bacterium]